MTNNKLLPYSMIIIAMVIWGSIGIFRRNIPVPSEFLAFARGLLGAIFLFILMIYKRNLSWNKISKKSVALLALIGGLIGFNWILLFEAFNYTTVAVATLCYYMEPSMVILLAPLFFNDKLTVKKWLIVILTVLGMVMVSGILETDSLQEKEYLGIAFGLSAAFAYALIVITNKRVEQIDTYLKTFIELFSAAIVMVPYLLFTNGFVAMPTDFNTLLLLLIVGIIHTGIAYALYFGGMKGLSAQSVAICSYIDPISALFLSAFILNESLTTLGIAGAVLIIGTAAIGELTANKK